MEKAKVYDKIRIFKPKNKHMKNRHKFKLTVLYTYDYDENDDLRGLSNFLRSIVADIDYRKNKRNRKKKG